MERRNKLQNKSRSLVLLCARIVGKRAFWGFLLVTVLATGVLAAINIVSKYALKLYTEDQLKVIPWDAVVYQSDELPQFKKLSQGLSNIGGVKHVESFGLLRVQVTPQMLVEVENTRVFIPWVTVVSATDARLLPPELRPSEGGGADQAILTMLGPQKIIKPYLDRIRQGDHVVMKYSLPEGRQVELLTSRVAGVAQMERTEMVKWIMQEIGSAAFIPQLGLLVVVPMERFIEETARFHTIFRQMKLPTESAEAVSEQELMDDLSGAFVPEIDHLVAFDRGGLVSGWDLQGSQEKTAALVQQVRSVATGVDIQATINSDLLMMLEKLIGRSKLVGLVSILISLPLLWMAWIFAGNLASLIALNERRVVGLLRLRGLPAHSVGRGFSMAIGLGGLLGGILGATLGTAVPLFAYSLNGSAVPLGLLHKVQDPWFLILFVIVGTILGLVAGRKVTRYVTRLTPLEASRRVSGSETLTFEFKFRSWQLLALVLGSYKIVTWIGNYSLQLGPLQPIDGLLNFVGIPLFIYGIASLVASRSQVTQSILGWLATPLVGNLKWFVVKTMMMRPHRVMSMILIASLMFSVTIYPRITSDSFYDKAVRGIRASAGSDLSLVFDAVELSDGEVKSEATGRHLAEVGEKAGLIVEKVRAVEGVRSAEPLYEFTIPSGFYMRGQTGLPLYLLGAPERYLETVYHEKQLGRAPGKGFGEIIASLGKGAAISSGLASYLELETGARAALGTVSAGEPGRTEVQGILNVLPGAPQVMLQNREAYVSADIEFINYLSRTNPFVVARAASPGVGQWEGMLSRLVVLVDLDEGANVAAVRGQLESKVREVAKLAYVKSSNEEEQKVSKDMFISLALENMKVYMIGGIVVALAGIIAISIANYLESRRTFALLRIRGASPSHLVRIAISDFFVPILCGMVVGLAVGILAGYGLTNQIFRIPRVISILEVFPVHLILSGFIFGVIGVLSLLFAATAVAFSLLIFRKSAREGLQRTT
ncbi:MAG: ABC transporter permease [Acidobacteria bacterium]|nr:ABC transporter permease [Acidobacteriota bacterium]